MQQTWMEGKRSERGFGRDFKRGFKRSLNRKQYRWLLLLAALLWILPGLRAEAATPYGSNGILSIKNGKVVNSKGKNFVMKGVSTHGIAWYPEYVNKAAFQTLRDKWGVNTIRLALYTAEYNGYCTGGSQSSLKKRISEGVQYATDLGMYVIIDWHILSDGNPLTYQTKAKQFFGEIAKKYAKYGNVMYEICNEPNGSGGSWKNIKRYAGTVIKAIRAVNTKAIIIVGTPNWSQNVDTAAASKISGYSNIAYAFHFYAATHQADMRKKLEGALKKGLPVIVTEFGISDASGSGSISTAQGNLWIQLLNKYSVGRVCWNLSNKQETSALLKASCTKKSGWSSADLSASGKWLVQTYTGKKVSSGSTTAGSSSGSTTTGGNASSGNTTAGSTTAPKKTAAASGKVKLKAEVTRVNRWKSGSYYFTQYKLVLKNNGKLTSKNWKVVLKLKKYFTMSNSWSASMKREGKTLTIRPADWNKKIAYQNTTEVGFIIRSSSITSIQSIRVSAS